MKTLYRYIAPMSLALVSTGCSDEVFLVGGNDNLDENTINLSASYPSLTRASEAGFDDRDEMGIFVLDYVDGNTQTIGSTDVHAENVSFQFIEADGSWKSESKLYWTSDATPADIIGYYPFVSNMGTSAYYSFSIQRKQNNSRENGSMGGYESSDFLWGKSEKVMPTAERVNLSLSHLMSCIRVTLLEGNGFSEGEWNSLDKIVVIPNIHQNVDIDMEKGSVGQAYGETVSVIPFEYVSEWRGVVTPQSKQAGENLIDITVGNDSYHLVKNSSVSYESGKLNTFTITVDKRSEGGLQFSLTDESITPWIDDLEFRDGIVRNYISVNVHKRGSLSEVVRVAGLSPSALVGLKLSGEIDEKDFDFLREGCTSLKNLNLSDVSVWYGDRKNVIPERAMYQKKTLARIIFPKTLEVIGSDAFYECGLMGSLIIPEGVTKIGERTFNQDNSGNISFNYGTFAQCGSLYGELSLPSTLEFIEDNAFARTGFTGTLDIPESVKTIGNQAFVGNQFSGDLIIPDGVENIGSSAFRGIPFTGSLTLPKGIKTIYAMTFADCGFSGVLNLPEGLRNIEVSAFAGANLRGELKIPSTVQRISNHAFERTKISSLVLPDNLYYLGNAAFADCSELRGSVSIPSKVQRICQELFSGCSKLNEVILPEGILTIGGAAFYKCLNLSHVVCEATEPPMIDEIKMPEFSAEGLIDIYVGPFDGLSKPNLYLEVPKASIGLYREAKGWNELSRISEYSGFICRPALANALNTRHTETLVLNSEGAWEVIEKPDWCELSKTSGESKSEIVLTISALNHGAGNREGKIVFGLKDTDVISECIVSQFDYLYEEDECVTLQKASRGKGIDVVFLGDGWDASSIADGSYLNRVNEQMEAFFGIEPYASYRDRFNVYVAMSLSQESGVNTASTWYNTRFLTFFSYDWDNSTTLSVDDPDMVFDYAVSKTPLTADNINKSLVIISLNNNEYGSSTILTEEGGCIALCCADEDNYPMDTRGIIQHEACGHAFGKLAEERIVKNKFLPDERRDDIELAQMKGWYRNISLSGKMSDIWWSDLIYDQRYSDKVDIFEGAFGYTQGVYRAEINSCMNYGIPYFSAPARLDIMRRILEYSGEGFTMEKFYATDSDKWGATGSTRAAMPDASDVYVNSGMHHPVRIVKSKKY